MDNQQLLLQNIKQIPYDYNEEKQELNKILGQARELNQIQAELASIIDIQDEDIQTINTSTEEVAELAVKANYHLESASGKKFKISPLMIGGAVGALFTLPVTLGTAAGGAIVGYAAAAGGVLGAVAGKKLA